MRLIAGLAASAAALLLTAANHNGGALASQALTSKSIRPTATLAAANTKPAVPAPVMVTVGDGDTLSSIASNHQTTYVRIFNANESVTNPDVINVGQQLRIPTANEQLPDRYAAFQATVAPVPPPAPVAAATSGSSSSTPYSAPAAPASYPAVSANSAKAYIYAHESGNNPGATSPNGCFGLGQDCSGRLRASCGLDYACQDAYFTSYANGRYGGWSGALAFWQANGWW